MFHKNKVLLHFPVDFLQAVAYNIHVVLVVHANQAVQMREDVLLSLQRRFGNGNKQYL